MKKSTPFIIAAGAIAGFAATSRLVFHRSGPATLLDGYQRGKRLKSRFAEQAGYDEFLRRRAEENERTYQLPGCFRPKCALTHEIAHSMDVYTLRPADARPLRIVYLHGGCYINRIDSYLWPFLDRIAAKSRATVSVPLYPLAPVHGCAESFEKLGAYYRDLRERNPHDKIVFMGDSAGGALCLALSMMLTEAGEEGPAGIVAFSPWVDATLTNPEILDYEASDPVLSAYGLSRAAHSWAGTLDKADWRISPTNGPLETLPPTLVFAGTNEIFYPDLDIFREKLARAGVTYTFVAREGMGHCWPTYPIPEALESDREICAFLDEGAGD